MQPNTMLTNTCFNSVQWLRHMLQIEFKTTRFCNSSPHFSVFFSKELRTAGSELKVLLCLRINANCYKCMKVKKHLPIRERDRLTAVVKGNWRKKYSCTQRCAGWYACSYQLEQLVQHFILELSVLMTHFFLLWIRNRTAFNVHQ